MFHIALLRSLLLEIFAGQLVLCLPLALPFNSKCVPFKSSICNTLGASGYDHTPFPHPLAPSYIYAVSVLETVANEIIQRTVSSGCSTYAAMFLCFAYFPLCDVDKLSVPPIVPCKSLCERVKKDCSSENIVTWLPWDCDIIGNYSTGSLCIDINDTSIRSNIINATIATPVDVQNGSMKGPLVCTGCSSGLLLPNSTLWAENYTAASKVSVISRLVLNGTVTYNVTVDVVYAPRPCRSGSQQPAFAIFSTIRSPSCTCQDMEVGESYLVGGYQTLDSSSNVAIWNVTAEGTVASWSDSYVELIKGWVRASSDRACV